MDSIPLFVRKFAVDAIEGTVAAALALTFAVPGSVGDVRVIAAAVVIGAAHACVSAARRNAPDFYEWLTGVFKTNG